MAGVKGRSGRPNRFNEFKIAQLADMSVLWALENFESLAKEEKIKILTTVAVKYIPQHIENSGEVIITHKIEPFDIDERLAQLITERQTCSVN